MTALQLYKHLERMISLGCSDYQIIFMRDEKYPHSVGSVSPDHAGKTIDLYPYGEEDEVNDDSETMD